MREREDRRGGKGGRDHDLGLGLGLRILMVGECTEEWAERHEGEREGGGGGINGVAIGAGICGSSIRGRG